MDGLGACEVLVGSDVEDDGGVGCRFLDEGGVVEASYHRVHGGVGGVDLGGFLGVADEGRDGEGGVVAAQLGEDLAAYVAGCTGPGGLVGLISYDGGDMREGAVSQEHRSHVGVLIFSALGR